MATIAQLKKQIQAEQDKITKVKEMQKVESEKASLKNQLKILQRSPGTKRNIALAQRTARGFKRLAGIGGQALIKQAKLIKEQQMREDAAFRRVGKTVSKKLKKSNKRLSKKLKKTTKSKKKSSGKSVTFSFN